MQLIDAFILGIVQGLTEFLPVSSSGHLVVAQTLLGTVSEGGIVFEVSVHVATLVAIVLFYRKRIGGLVVGVIKWDTKDLRYIGKLAVGTIPAVLVALTLRGFIESQFHSPELVGVMLIVTGFIVWTTRYTISWGEASEPTWRNALLIGCAQAFAILPGIARSGTTLAAAMALGMSPLAAAEFSFLLGVIAIAGAAVLMLPELAQVSSAFLTDILVGGTAALVERLAALVSFIWLLKSQRFFAFSIYAWTVGAGFLAWLALH